MLTDSDLSIYLKVFHQIVISLIQKNFKDEGIKMARKYEYWNKEMELKSRKELDEIQSNRLRALEKLL